MVRFLFKIGMLGKLEHIPVIDLRIDMAAPFLCRQTGLYGMLVVMYWVEGTGHDGVGVNARYERFGGVQFQYRYVFGLILVGFDLFSGRKGSVT